MQAFERIAEQRIQEAVEAGELENLPGRGKPLHLDDDRLVPGELRAAHRILKNAGLVPPSLVLRAAITELERQVDALSEGHERVEARQRLALLRLRMEAERGQGSHALAPGCRYEGALPDRLRRG